MSSTKRIYVLNTPKNRSALDQMGVAHAVDYGGAWLMSEGVSARAASELSAKTFDFVVSYDDQTAVDLFAIEAFKSGRRVRRLAFIGDGPGWVEDSGRALPFEDAAAVERIKKQECPDSWLVLEAVLLGRPVAAASAAPWDIQGPPPTPPKKLPTAFHALDSLLRRLAPLARATVEVANDGAKQLRGELLPTSARAGLSARRIEALRPWVPPSYLRFLRASDGAVLGHDSFKFLAGGDQLQMEAQQDHRERLRLADAKLDVRGLVIAWNPSNLAVAFFEQSGRRRADGEWPVVFAEEGSGTEVVFPSFTEFLREVCTRLLTDLPVQRRRALSGSPELERDVELGDKILEAIARPCLELQPGEVPASDGDETRFGGVPSWPADRAWPRERNGEPLVFVLQIRAEDIAPLVIPPEGADLLCLFVGEKDQKKPALAFEWIDSPSPARRLAASKVPQRTGSPKKKEPPRTLMVSPAVDLPFEHDIDVARLSRELEVPRREVARAVQLLTHELAPSSRNKIGGYPWWAAGNQPPKPPGAWRFWLQLGDPIDVGLWRTPPIFTFTNAAGDHRSLVARGWVPREE